MPQIPRETITLAGENIPIQSQHARAPLAAFGTGPALSNLGAGLERAAGSFEAIEKDRQRKAELEIALHDEATAQEANTNATREALKVTDDYRSTQGSQALDRLPTFEPTLKEIQDRHAQGLSPKAAQMYNRATARQFTTFLGEASNHARTEGQVYRQQANIASTATAVELATRSITNPAERDRYFAQIEGYTRQYAEDTGMPKEAADVAVAKNKGDAWAAGISEIRRTNLDAAQALFDEHKDEIPTGHRLAIEGELAAQQRERQAELDRAQARAEREQDMRLRVADRNVGLLTRIVDAGVVPKPEMWEQVAGQVKGTELESDFAALQDTMVDRAKFVTLPLDVQAAEVAGEHDRLTDPKVGANLSEAINVNWKARTYDATVSAINADPLTAAAERGVTKLTEIDLSSPESIAAGLPARNQQAEIASIWSGQPTPPLTVPEIHAVANTLQKQPPAQQAMMLSGLYAGTRDPAKFNAMMAQLAPKNTALATAGKLLTESDPSAPIAGELILKGENYLNPQTEGEKPKVAIPSEALFRADFDAATEGIYGAKANVRDTDMRNTMRIYAALSVEEGVYGDTKSVDGTKLDRALKLATGGVGEYNDKNIVLPRGMDEDRFQDAIQTQLSAMNREHPTGYTDEQLHGLQLENAGQAGQRGYYVLQGNAYLLDDRGRKVFVSPDL